MAKYDLKLDQLDVKTAFLHGDLDEEIFIPKPVGYKAQGSDLIVLCATTSTQGVNMTHVFATTSY